MLEYTHIWALVAASLAIAFMAGFTGLSLLSGASDLPIATRKVNICKAALVLGGGIWSMHFVAMLGVRLPIDFYYDPLTTLISALIAVLFVGIALLILHFWERSAVSITLAGSIVGVGVLAMHYGGMSGIQLCLPVYSPLGVFITVVTSIFLNICVFWVAYGKRTHKNILLGTVFFGFSVFAVHYVAMADTGFEMVQNVESSSLNFGNETLAFLVTFMAFLICSAFLLSSVTFLPSADNEFREIAPQGQPNGLTENPPVVAGLKFAEPVLEPNEQNFEPIKGPSSKIPYEHDGKTSFLYGTEIAAARAEGHYTILYSRTGKHFCPLSMSEVTSRLAGAGFVKTHRSYLVNPTFISGFERKKDNGVCYFDEVDSLEKIPVSRSQLSLVRETLGLS